MVRRIQPQDAAELLAKGGFDLIDVRTAAEFASGRVAGARNVPLDEVRADPRGTVRGDRVVFVCAAGVRSFTAATAADAAGIAEVFSIEGGTNAWASAGLPTEAGGATITAAPTTKTAAALPVGGPPSSDDTSCGLPEPGLDAVVGENLRVLRNQRGMSLDDVAKRSGVSRTLLGQIEIGKTAPSVDVVWRLASVFEVHFSALLASGDQGRTTMMRSQGAKRLERADGRYASRALFPLTGAPEVELYELYLAPHSREDAQAHQPGTREHLVVASGRLELHVGSERHDLGPRDAIVFNADVPHAYVNPDKTECWMYLVMTYRTSEKVQ